MIRTKIVTTLGPATSTAPILTRLFQEGADVCRLNFSHGELADHARLLAAVRQAAAGFGDQVGVLGDLQGPKIRLGKIADQDGTGGMPVAVGDTLTIQRQPMVGAAGRVSTTYERFIDDVKPGDRILVEDGLIHFLVTDKRADELACTCTLGGVLKSSKGINLPNTAVSVPAITERDWQCVDWATEHGLEFLALSFVRRPEELIQLRQRLAVAGSDIKLIAKIEKPQALEQIDGIIDAADGLMVARGDLGVEMDVARVPTIQKDLIRRCQSAGKCVIVATQMLQSMIESPWPTRAEVSDVANAIIDGADAVMLSGETSVGKYPAEAVRMMAHIAEVTEKYLVESGAIAAQPRLPATSLHLSSAAVAHGAWQIVRDMSARLVVVWSQSGTTAQIFSKNRFPVPVIALSSDQRALRRMSLLYGVVPMQAAPALDMGRLIEQVDGLLVARKLAAAGDRIIIVAGSSLGSPGTMNSLVIHTVGQDWKPTTESAAGL